MPHFTFISNDDDTIAQVLKDGQPYDEGVKLEPAWQIVSTYFKLAGGNLKPMAKTADDEARRFHGLQAFLMSLTGVEAFTNIFFQLLADELNKPDLLKKVRQQGPLVPRLTACIGLAFDAPLENQAMLLQRVRELYQLRNQIVHPRWDPASITIVSEYPIMISGLAQNFQRTFEDVTFCHEAFFWCLLLIARIGKARGNNEEGVGAFCFQWAGMYGLRESWLLTQLNL